MPRVSVQTIPQADARGQAAPDQMRGWCGLPVDRTIFFLSVIIVVLACVHHTRIQALELQVTQTKQQAALEKQALELELSRAEQLLEALKKPKGELLEDKAGEDAHAAEALLGRSPVPSPSPAEPPCASPSPTLSWQGQVALYLVLGLMIMLAAA
eukprot:tig00000806_g4362.t1